MAACAVTSATLLAGCGDEGKMEPPSTRESTSQIVEVVNQYFAAVESKDGAEACANLTEFGRQIVVKVLRGETEGKSPGVRQYDPSECEATVEAPTVDVGGGLPRVGSSQVTISTNGRSARVAERGGTGNELAVKLVEGQWQIVVPVFTGR